MSKYYYTDGKERFGPFSYEEMATKGIAKETLVWMEGLADWIPAGNLAELQSLFSAQPAPLQPQGMSYGTMMLEKPPKNWLVEAVLVTLFCCLPLGIVGIVFASKVETLWKQGQRDAAIKASQDAGKWIKIGFFVGISVWLIYAILMIFGLVASAGAYGN